MRLEINLEHYQVFYYVAKLGSISKTAEALHLTQPAVSHIIKLLEYRLGCQLFYRRSRGVCRDLSLRFYIGGYAV